MYVWSTVFEHSRNVYAHLQSDLHDVAAWALERMSPVSCANVTRFSARHMGRHQ